MERIAIHIKIPAEGEEKTAIVMVKPIQLSGEQVTNTFRENKQTLTVHHSDGSVWCE